MRACDLAERRYRFVYPYSYCITLADIHHIISVCFKPHHIITRPPSNLAAEITLSQSWRNADGSPSRLRSRKS